MRSRHPSVSPIPDCSDPRERVVGQIDLSAVRANCAQLCRQLQGDRELCAVVKADAYGHGATQCAKAALNGGATRLAVATAQEANALAGQVGTPILVMGAIGTREVELAVAWPPK
jgi:alanine racemase